MRKIKPLILYNMNYLDGVFKPMFENKLECTGLIEVTFKAFVLKDLLEMTGKGIPRGSISLADRKCNPLSIKDNASYKVMLDRNISKNIPDCKEWFIAYVTINYVNRIIKTEVWYESKAGARNSQEFKNKF